MCSVSLLRYFNSVKRHLLDPIGMLFGNVPPPEIQQVKVDVLLVEKLDNWQIDGMSMRISELGDCTVGLQLSSEHALTPQ